MEAIDHPLREYREAHGLTLEDIAIAADTSPATISRIENGKVHPSMDLAGRIKAATKGAVTPNDFLLPTKKRRAS